MSSDYYPAGYNGTDAPSEILAMQCSSGHKWLTDVHYECGGTSVERDECPTCGRDGAWCDNYDGSDGTDDVDDIDD